MFVFMVFDVMVCLCVVDDGSMFNCLWFVFYDCCVRLLLCVVDVFVILCVLDENLFCEIVLCFGLCVFV